MRRRVSQGGGAGTSRSNRTPTKASSGWFGRPWCDPHPIRPILGGDSSMHPRETRSLPQQLWPARGDGARLNVWCGGRLSVRSLTSCARDRCRVSTTGEQPALCRAMCRQRSSNSQRPSVISSWHQLLVITSDRSEVVAGGAAASTGWEAGRSGSCRSGSAPR